MLIRDGDIRRLGLGLCTTTSRLRKWYVQAKNAESGKNSHQRSQYVTSADVGPRFTHTKLLTQPIAGVIVRADSDYDAW